MGNLESYDCFLSYDSQDEAAAQKLAADLRSQGGLKVWVDQDQVLPGT